MPDIASLDTIIRDLRINWSASYDYGEYRDWSDRHSVSYAFPSDVDDGIFYSEGDHLVHMTALQKTFGKLAFELWDDVVPLQLNPHAGDRANILFAYSSETDGDGTYTQTFEEYFGTHLTDARIWMNSGWATHDEDSDFFFGSKGFNTYLHEIGHSLGLTHPGRYDAGDSDPPTYADDALFAQDTMKNTVMSYFPAYADGGSTDHWGSDGMYKYASTPLLYDIAAMQRIYGVDTETRTDDTVYGFHSNAGKVIDGMLLNPFDFTSNPNPVFCIWDADGTDTLDASGFTTAQHINLAEGAFSSIGSLTDNVSIAFGARIENAVGGAGRDEIRGNDSNNVMNGGGGDDNLVAGVGLDTLIGGSNNDTLWGAVNDSLLGGQGNDTYYATTGDRIVEYAGRGTDRIYTELAAYTMSSETEQLTFISFDDFHPSAPHTAYGNISGNTITGMADVDTFNGNGGADYLYGRQGNDILSGGTGNDHLYGEQDNDTLNGDTQADYLYGGAGTDRLLGGAGIDHLVGGEGKDQLTGGADADTFVFNTPSDSSLVRLRIGTVDTVLDGVDTITDFRHGVDHIDLRGIDANAATHAINEHFALLASPARFHGDWTAKMWIEVTRTPLHIADTTVLYASTDADAVAEFQVKCNGLVGLGGADLMP